MRQDWIWDGGRPCVDLLNTLRDRKTRPRELLGEPADLAEWLTLAGLLDAGTPVEATAVVRACAVREAIDRCITARVLGQRLGADDVDLVNACAADHRLPPAQLRLDSAGVPRVHRAPAADPAGVALGAVALDAIELLAATEPPAVRVCALSTCGLRFVDQSPAANRQWCSMARCGNRAKARLHYSRKKAKS